MKTAAVVAVIVAILGIGFLLVSNSVKPQLQLRTDREKHTQQAPVNQSADNTQVAFCTASQLQATASPEVAAGNVYVTLTIQNITQSACQVVGNNSLQVGYPNSVSNFQIAHKGGLATPVFTLEPNQTIYSLVHFPNGPQCSSEATDVDSMVSYDISQNESISFAPTQGSTISIPSCGNASEITTIDLYPFSTSQVTPQ